MIRDSLSKRTFLVCYGSRNVVDTSLQQNSKKNTRNQKKRTCFCMVFSFGRKLKERKKMDLNVEISNEEDEGFKLQQWQQLEDSEMIISWLEKSRKNKRKNSEEPAQSIEQTRTESVLTLQGRGPIDYTTIKNPTYQKG